MNPSVIAKRNWQVYQKSPSFLARALATLRPFICPFERLMTPVEENATQLDIGCGNGVFLSLCCEYKKISKGLGVDVNQAALDVAKTCHKEAPLEFQKCENPSDWPSEHFDVVSLIDVLHHVPPDSQKDFLCKALERVGNGGRVIYKDMARKPFFFAFANRLHDLVLARQWIHYFPFEEALKIIEAEGFEIEDTYVQTCFVYRHEGLVAKKMKA